MKNFKPIISAVLITAFSVSICLGQSKRISQAQQLKQSIVSDNAINYAGSLNVIPNQPADFPDLSVRGTRGLLFNNGPFVTSPGAGPGGADVSVLAPPLDSYGFGHSTATGYSVAEDITTDALGWTIDSLVFYAYQTNSTTTSTFTIYRVQIWDGIPGQPGSNIIWGDLTTNLLSRTGFSNCYRALDSVSTARPIMRNVVNTPGLALASGTYWIEWQAGGSLGSGPWANPITILGQQTTGNAMQNSGTAWADLLDGGTSTPQGLPFEVYGEVGLPACLAPSTLNAANITDVSADLSWVETGTATLWNVEWGTTGFVQGTGTLLSGLTATNTSLSGLTASTSYSFYVQADCGGGDLSVWVGPYTFTTQACAVSGQCTFGMSFTDSWGDGWNGASVQFIQNGVTAGTFTLATGASGTNNVSLCDAATIQLVWTNGTYPDECGFILTDPWGSTITSITAPNYPAQGVFFTFTASCTPPSCPKPTNLSASGMTLTSAILSWTNGGSETAWNIEYGPAGFIQGTGTVIPVTTNPYTLTGLTPATAYNFYVQADCGGAGTSNWSDVGAFNTLCNIVNTFPWTEGFENGIPCYTVTGPSAETWVQGTDSPLSGTYDAQIDYDATLAQQDQWLISPLFDFTTLTGPQITFNWNMSYYWGVTPNDNYDMFLKVTTDGGSNWTTLWTEPAVFTDWTYYDTTLSLATYAGVSTFQFAFHYYGLDGASFYLDDITIDNILSVENIMNDKQVSVYPNPATDLLYIVNSSNPSVSIYNSLGEIVISENKTKIDISALSQGIYFVKVTDANGTFTSPLSVLKK